MLYLMDRTFVLKLYVATLVVFLAIDFVWLTVVAQTFYQEQIGFLLTKNPNVFAAVLFYALFVIGLLYFVVLPALKSKTITRAHVSMAGGFFGLVTYATYDLTNYATIANWPLVLVVVDMVWGTVLAASVTAISFILGKRFSK